MRRGFLLLLVGVTALCWLAAPAAPGGASPSPAAQRSTTTVAVATTAPLTTAPRTTVPTTSAETVAPTTAASAPAAPTTVAAADATPRKDPAADRLRHITYALVGLGALVLLLNVVFWRLTRPALVPAASTASAADPSTGPSTRRSKAAKSAAKGAASVPAVAGAVAGTAAAPVKIPASAFLATPPGAPIPGLSAAAGAAGAVGAIAGAAGSGHEPDPPPVGTPAIDAPAPLADIPLGAPKPLVGTDSAWIIEPDTGSGLTPESPTAGDFPEDPGPTVDLTDASADPGGELADDGTHGHPVGATLGAPDVATASAIEVSGVEAAAPAARPDAPVEAAYPPATQALISALSAIPDQEPTVVRFDDPPVERVRRRRPPSGAPGFDRIAKEATASQAIVDASGAATASPPGATDRDVERVTPVPRRPASDAGTGRGAVDDMALMASALSSLPPRHAPVPDDPELPPVGEFYDQDLDPGDPPGRD